MKYDTSLGGMLLGAIVLLGIAFAISYRGLTMKTNRLRSSFWYGILFAIAVHIAFEDYLGLEGYVSFVRSHWTELPWAVGATLALFWCFMQGVNENRHEKESQDREEEACQTGTWPGKGYSHWTPD
jgi:hypothetical protein